MKDLKDTLTEGLLGDIEDTIAAGDDAAMKLHILKQLRNSELYYTNTYISDDKLFNIFKNRGKWKVDVNGYITCFCTEDGYLTDGSFSFNSVKELTIFEDDEQICKCKSLKYGPSIIYGDLYIANCPNLKDLKDCPRLIAGEVTVKNTGITTLKYFPKACESIQIIGNKNLKTIKDAKRCSVTKTITIMHNGVKVTNNEIKEMPWKKEGGIDYTNGDDSFLAKIYKS